MMGLPDNLRRPSTPSWHTQNRGARVHCRRPCTDVLGHTLTPGTFGCKKNYHAICHKRHFLNFREKNRHNTLRPLPRYLYVVASLIPVNYHQISCYLFLLIPTKF